MDTVGIHDHVTRMETLREQRQGTKARVKLSGDITLDGSNNIKSNLKVTNFRKVGSLTASVTSGSLPSGYTDVNVDKKGNVTVNGSGAVANDTTFTVSIDGSKVADATKNISLSPSPVPALSGDITLDSSNKPQSNLTLDNVSSITNPTVSVSGGSLPSGYSVGIDGSGNITLSGSGAISSDASFTLEVTGDNARSTTQSFSLNYQVIPTLSGDITLDGSNNPSSTLTIDNNGDINNAAATVDSGSLPSGYTGLSVDGSGKITMDGSGSVSSNTTFTVKVTGDNARSATKEITLTTS